MITSLRGSTPLKRKMQMFNVMKHAHRIARHEQKRNGGHYSVILAEAMKIAHHMAKNITEVEADLNDHKYVNISAVNGEDQIVIEIHRDSVNLKKYHLYIWELNSGEIHTWETETRTGQWWGSATVRATLANESFEISLGSKW